MPYDPFAHARATSTRQAAAIEQRIATTRTGEATGTRPLRVVPDVEVTEAVDDGVPLTEVTSSRLSLRRTTDRGRVALPLDVGGTPTLVTYVDLSRRLLVVDGLWAPKVSAGGGCDCEGCPGSGVPTDEWLRTLHVHPEPVRLQSGGRLRLTDGQQHLLGTDASGVAALVQLVDVGLLVIGDADRWAVDTPLSTVRLPRAQQGVSPTLEPWGVPRDGTGPGAADRRTER